MINFFRKERKKLADNNKTVKYMRYAIGEIALVVVGILIALSINNWNQNRINQIEKKELLSKLNTEFNVNIKILNDFRIIEDKAMNAMIELINLVGASELELSNHNLDSLFFESFPSNELAFATNAVNNIVQNGGLNLFKDETINTLLYQWNSLKEIRKNRLEKIDDWNNDQFLPFIKSYISFREMDNYSNYRWAGKSKVKPNYYPLFQKVEFENFLDNSLWLHQQIIERLEETKMLINQIIEVTKLK